MSNSFATHNKFTVAGQSYNYASLSKFSAQHNISKLPISLKIFWKTVYVEKMASK